MKKKRFLQLLESKLISLDEKTRNKILHNYEKDINRRVFYGEKESNVVKSYGNIDELALKIIEACENDKFAKIIDSIKNGINKSFNKVRRVFSRKEKKVNVEKEKISINKRNDFKEKISNLNLIKKKNKKVEEPILLLESNSEPLEIDIDEIEKKIELNLSVKYRIYGVFLSFALVLFVILFLISFIGLLDGTVFLGVSLLCASLLVFVYLGISIWYKKVFGKVIDYRKIFFILIGNLILCGLSIGLSVFSYFRYDEVEDVTNYYIMAKEIKEFDLPKDETIKYYLDFNSNYDSKYRVTYDDTLDGSIKVEVNYFRNYYNLNFKTYRNSLYVSFHKSFRNRLSTFLEGVRDKKIYNNNEFERYTITIYMNSIDKDRIIINN